MKLEIARKWKNEKYGKSLIPIMMSLNAPCAKTKRVFVIANANAKLN